MLDGCSAVLVRRSGLVTFTCLFVCVCILCFGHLCSHLVHTRTVAITQAHASMRSMRPKCAEYAEYAAQVCGVCGMLAGDPGMLVETRGSKEKRLLSPMWRRARLLIGPCLPSHLTFPTDRGSLMASARRQHKVSCAIAC